ncbi:hypothetical protein DKW60_20590 [Leucothrix pacifica]|uniref:Uncharacterized protein n=1 Tax=Leucothrix pacifica TaxID=1247513 RepID=A0A317C2L0_9GAMM|nr:hypothetical protein DKW60_20590 [Leucothrix pacifica]
MALGYQGLVTEGYQAETKMPNFMKFGTYKYKPHEAALLIAAHRGQMLLIMTFASTKLFSNRH